MPKLPFLIAEIGINHNGNMNIAKKLIDQAAETGFHAVKFQKRDIDLVYTQDFLSEARESPWGKTQRDQKNALEFEKEEFDEIDNYCNKKKMIWFASAWDLNSLNFLDNYNLKYHKVASAMIVDKKFINEVSKRKIHTFISTGMTEKKDIDEAVSIFRKNECPFELMHCVSTYPAEPHDINLNTINALKSEYKCDVGYSGHENGIAISVAASTLGISSLERHITLDRTMYGSDQAASLELSGFRNMINSINKIHLAFGEEKIGHITDEEKKISKKLRQHIN
jgi:N-acetylneuraminate synthase